MDSKIELFMQRAQDELLLAQTDMRISQEEDIKKILGILITKTFYHSVISHAYYAIFNGAKAYLCKKGIITTPPAEHRKTYEKFKEQVDTGHLDKELLDIYEDELMKASVLLRIFKREKRKRGKFTYNIKAAANIPYAQESITHAREFVSMIGELLKI